MKLDADMLAKLPFALRVEIEENAQRKPLTQSELAFQQRRILAELRKYKAPGERTDLKAGTSAKPFAEVRATDVVGKLFNESGRQVEKRLAIVEAAESEPERFGTLAADMDRTDRVDRVYKRLKVARARDAYQQRRHEGGTVADLAALAASGYRAAAILADPAWPWETWGGESGKVHTSADHHFDPMTLADIERLPVAPLAADDCLLLLWVTWPHLPSGLAVMSVWGFTYKTVAFVWVKQNESGIGLHTGPGYWTRANSEVCLLGTRGSPMRLAEDVHQIIEAPVGEHSAKPEETHDRVERLVAGPYLELFARRERPGWLTWGDEVQPPLAASA
jgi:N6-adenosine-specific RNA methylase IME4